jgi:hypothetical protein
MDPSGEKLAVNEFFALFGRTPNETRWVGRADSEEYLAIVTYLAERSDRR